MPQSTPGQNVIVVDDDAFQLALFEKQLLRQGLTEVCGFSNGAEALAHLAENAFPHPLILLDLNMPEMDGVEFVRKLVELEYPGALALVSGVEERVLDSVARLATAHHLDVVGHLKKPVQNDALAKILTRWQAHISKKLQKPAKIYGREEIDRALSQHELINWYQPKVRLADGEFYGVEALVRWQHPHDGLVFPDQFIGPAEEHGLIGEMTTLVLVEALEQQRRWKSDGLNCSVAVNVSMDSLVSLDFPNEVQRQLSRIGVTPEFLILEVTESRLTQDLALRLDILSRLRLKKISLSIDDFGTGHSSLAQLRDLPFNELKIDRSFVHGAEHNTTQRAIVDTNLLLAKQLDMRVVGEGIEDKADWNFLRSRGCDFGQGYFIGKPMPGTALPEWTADWQTRSAEVLAP